MAQRVIPLAPATVPPGMNTPAIPPGVPRSVIGEPNLNTGKSNAATAARWQYVGFNYVTAAIASGVWADLGTPMTAFVSADSASWSATANGVAGQTLIAGINIPAVTPGQNILVTFTIPAGFSSFTSVKLGLYNNGPQGIGTEINITAFAAGTYSFICSVGFGAAFYTGPRFQMTFVTNAGTGLAAIGVTNFAILTIPAGGDISPLRRFEFKTNPAIYAYFIAAGSPQFSDGVDDGGIVTIEFINGGVIVSSVQLPYGTDSYANCRDFMATVPDEPLVVGWQVPNAGPGRVTNSPNSGFNLFRWSAQADTVRFTFQNNFSRLALNPPAITGLFCGVLQRAGEGGD